MLLLDAPVRVGGGVGFRDHLAPRSLHRLPRPPAVRAAALEQGVSMVVEPGSAPEAGSAAGLQVERAELSLVRVEARRRAGAGEGARPLAVARALWATLFDASGGRPLTIRAPILEPDRPEVERALEGRPTRLVLVGRYRLPAIEPPAEVRIRLDPLAARDQLRQDQPGPSLLAPDRLDRAVERLVDAGLLEVEGTEPEPSRRRLLARWVGAVLFEPEVAPGGLDPAALAGDPVLAEADLGASVGLRLRGPSELPSGPIEVDATRGLLTAGTFLTRSPVVGPFPPPPLGAPRLAAVGDWRGILGLEVEIEPGPARFELTPAAPEHPLPGPAERCRARARLDPAASTPVLEAPGWTAWGPIPLAGLEPQRVAGRGRFTCALGWVDPALVATATVELVGPDGVHVVDLSGGRPEWTGTLVGQPHRVSAEGATGDGATHALRAPVAPGATLVPQPALLPAPVLVRLVDPLGRFEWAEVELTGGPGLGRRRFRLSAGAPEAVWTPPDDPDPYLYGVELRHGDGRVERHPLRPAPAGGTLLVGDAGIELRSVELSTRAGAWLVLEAEDPPEVAGSAVEVYLEAGERRRVDLPFRVGAPFAFRVFGERTGPGGEREPIPSQRVETDRWLA